MSHFASHARIKDKWEIKYPRTWDKLKRACDTLGNMAIQDLKESSYIKRLTTPFSQCPQYPSHQEFHTSWKLSRSYLLDVIHFDGLPLLTFFFPFTMLIYNHCLLTVIFEFSLLLRCMVSQTFAYMQVLCLFVAFLVHISSHYSSLIVVTTLNEDTFHCISHLMQLH